MAEEATAETQTQTTTEAAQPAATATDTQTQTQETGASQEGKATEKQTQTQTEKPKLKPADFFRQREDKREQKAQAEVAELRRKVAEYEKAAQRQPEPVVPVSFIDDPDKWGQQVKEDARREAIEAIEQREAVKRYEQSAGQAVDWLLTRSHIREDVKLAEQVAAVVKERYQHIFQVDPAVAIEKGYMEVCAAKGISPDMGAFKKDSLNATGGTSTSGARASAAAGGKRTFNRGEGDKYILAGGQPGSPEYMRRLSEVEEARKDGRIR